MEPEGGWRFDPDCNVWRATAKLKAQWWEARKNARTESGESHQSPMRGDLLSFPAGAGARRYKPSKKPLKMRTGQLIRNNRMGDARQLLTKVECIRCGKENEVAEPNAN
jgi:hypothetical protein